MIRRCHDRTNAFDKLFIAIRLMEANHGKALLAKTLIWISLALVDTVITLRLLKFGKLLR